MKKLFFAVFIGALVGCATSTGPVPTGPDSYMIAIGGKTTASGGKLKAQAFREATEFCGASGKYVQVTSTQQRDMSFGVDPNAEIHFMCLDKNDPELTRTRLQKVPDTVVEIRK